MHINRAYYDLIHQKKLDVKTDFVEKLTHDSFIILIRQLPPKERTELEGVLQVFNQSFQLSSDAKLMEINEGELPENLLTNKILDRLRKGATDEEVLKQMIVEEEVESVIDKHVREKEQLAKQNEGMEVQLKTKDEELKNKDEVIESKDEELEKQRKIIEDLKSASRNKLS